MYNEDITINSDISDIKNIQKIIKIGTYFYNFQTSELECSDQLLCLLGLTEDSGIEPCAISCIHPDDREAVLETKRLAWENTESYDFIYRVIDYDEKIRFFHDKGEIEVDDYGVPLQITGVIHDITAQKLLEKRSQMMEDCMQSLLYLLQINTDSEKDIVKFALEEAIRLTKSEAGYIHFITPDQQHVHLYCLSDNIIPKTDIPEKNIQYPVDQNEIWAECIKYGKPVIQNDCKNYNYKSRCFEKEFRLNRHICIPVKDNDIYTAIIGVGNKKEPYSTVDTHILTLFASSMWEVVKRKRSEKDLIDAKKNLEIKIQNRTQDLENAYRILREREQDLRDAQNIAHIGNWKWDIIKNDLQWSDEIFRIFGISRHKFKESYEAFLEFVHPDDLELVKTAVNTSLSTGQTYSIDHRIVLPNGKIRIVHEHGRVYYDINRTPVKMAGTVQDITDLHKAIDETLSLSKVIEYAAEEIMLIGTDRKITYVNPAFEKITGYTKDEVTGKHPDFLKSGKLDDIVYENLWKTVNEGKLWQGKLITKTKSGCLIEEEANIAPIINNAGKITGFLSVKRDITEQSRIEKHLKQVHKMEAIGNLAGGIAHDFNNILAAIAGYSELAMREASLLENNFLIKCLRQILIASNRAKDVVRQILTFSRQKEQEFQPVNMKHIINETLNLLRASIPANIDINSNITNEDHTILGDPTQMHQVLMNLCTNSYHAINKKNGYINIILKTISISENDVIPEVFPKEGKFVSLIISDNGCGMDEQIKERIFEPYFTTKPAGKGTGLGLAMVHSIIKSHNGTISVYSEPGIGTSFSIILPYYTPAENIDDIYQQAIKNQFCGNEKILVVDDEPSISSIIKLALEQLGYRIEVHNSPIEALNRFTNNPADYDLIITDLTMPNMTGINLIRKMMKIRADIPFILCTGLANKINDKEITRLKISKTLIKPLGLYELSQSVREVLDTNQNLGTPDSN